MRAKAVKVVELEPIAEDQTAEWNELVRKAKLIVERGNKVQFELIQITGQIESKYGESRLQRWASEIGISYRTARRYRKLWVSGVDKQFVKEWGFLGYAVIREIIEYCGTNKQDQLHWLQIAKAEPMSADTIAARMRSFDSMGTQTKEDIRKDWDERMARKADTEQLQPDLKQALEQFAEAFPEMRPVILETSFLGKNELESIKLLEEKAGVRAIEYQKRLNQLRAFERKIKNQQRWWSENLDRFIEIVENNEADISYEVRSVFDLLCKTLEKGIAAKPKNWHVDPQLVDVVSLDEARAKKEANA